MTSTQDIVQKLWNLCHVLRSDGVTYHQYVTELTYILFLKMAEETEQESQLPKGYRWQNLVGKEGVEQLDFYRKMLVDLGAKGSDRVRAIYANASTSIREPRNLNKLITSIGELDWFSAKQDGFGDLYEGLLEKNATEKKSGAGQYFTPRALIDTIVEVVKPQPGEVIQDPAVGTGGFLIAANGYIRGKHDIYDMMEREQNFQRRQAFVGMELVQDTQRLTMMNLMLHEIESEVVLGDTLSPLGADLPKADVILTNPPFGSKGAGGKPTRDDFTYPTSNKQLAFLEHVYRGLKPGGRAAVVLPDNVLFEEGVGRDIRRDLMEKCNLHTILRLPTGIFYAQGVKTNVLFFTRGKTDEGNTKAVWFFDMRTNAPSFGKRTPLTRAHFDEFVKCFGKKADGTSRRKDLGEEGKFRQFKRAEIEKRAENLDITWLRDNDESSSANLAPPDEIAAEILDLLRQATEELESLSAELDTEVSA
ncbi:MAG: N-6 DNA methylase [Nannocystaceae bacterium]|nr:type I restriction-modification system subunit M [bacterium]